MPSRRSSRRTIKDKNDAEFTCVKNTIIILTSLSLTIQLIGIIASLFLVGNIVEKMNTEDPYVTKVYLIAGLIIYGVLLLSISLFGFIGAIKEKICISIFYTVILAIECILIIVLATHIYFPPFVFVIIIIFSLLYIAVCIKFIQYLVVRREEQRQIRRHGQAPPIDTESTKDIGSGSQSTSEQSSGKV